MRALLLIVFSCLCVLYSFSSVNESPLGSHNNPIKLAIVPSGHATSALSRAKPLISCIEKDTGYFTTLQIPNSYITVAEAMGSHKIDLAFGDISSFLIAHKKYEVKPFFQIIRYGTSYYQSMILVRSETPFKTIKDLNGKKFAYADASSASSYLLPLIEMQKNKVQFSQTLATGSMEAAISALLQKKVDAAAAFYNDPDPKTSQMRDVRKRLLSIYPDIEKQTRIIWISEPIPNEPIFIRNNLPEEIKTKLLVSLPNCVKKFPFSINNIEDLIPVSQTNNEYDAYLKMLEDSGLNIAKVFSKEVK